MFFVILPSAKLPPVIKQQAMQTSGGLLTKITRMLISTPDKVSSLTLHLLFFPGRESQVICYVCRLGGP